MKDNNSQCAKPRIYNNLEIMYERRMHYQAEIAKAEEELKGLKEGDEKFKSLNDEIAICKKLFDRVTESQLKKILDWYEKEEYPKVKEHYLKTMGRTSNK